MIESLTAASIAATVMLVRDEHKGSILLVEGPSDARVFKKFVDESLCYVLVTFNKENAIGSIGVLDSEGFVGSLSIVDADFWRLQGYSSPSENVLLTDTHDIETMILRSPALDAVLQELGSGAKIDQYQQRYGITPRDAVLDAAQSLGALRLVSLVDRLMLKFEGMKFTRFLSRGSRLEITLEALVKCVCELTRNHTIDRKQLSARVKSELSKDHDPWQLVCGHDMVSILSYALRKLIGSNNALEVAPEIIAKMLRLSYDQSYFHGTRLYAAIEHWETETGFQVFPSPDC